jgi:hypothetical protein
MDIPNNSSTPNSLQVEHDQSVGQIDSVHVIPTHQTPDSTKSGHPRSTEQTHLQAHTNTQEIDVSYMGAWASNDEPQEMTEQGTTSR